jgi:hypothetical protein
VVGHIFQARPVWIYTQSNITNIIYSPEYTTPTQKKFLLQVSNFLLQVSNFLLQVSNFLLQVSNFLLQVSNFLLQVSNFLLQVSNFLFCFVLRVAIG